MTPPHIGVSIPVLLLNERQFLQYQATIPLLEVSAAFGHDDLVDFKFSLVYFDDCISQTVLAGFGIHWLWHP